MASKSAEERGRRLVEDRWDESGPEGFDGTVRAVADEIRAAEREAEARELQEIRDYFDPNDPQGFLEWLRARAAKLRKGE